MKIISLGVGVQSTALYLMSSMGEIERYDYAIFADTGGEKKATLGYYDFLVRWSIANNGIPLHRAEYKNIILDLLNKTNSSGNRFAPIPAFTMNNGEKGMLRRQCTNEYKIIQVNKKIREILNITGRKRLPEIEMIQGITADEAHRMKIPQEKWKINVYPFCGYRIYSDGKCERIDTPVMNRGDIINWYKKKGFDLPEKSSCIFCPFQSDNNWMRLKEREPDSFELACDVDNAIRDSSKRGIKSKIYVHESLKPLRDVVFDQSQRTIWGNCSDDCDI